MEKVAEKKIKKEFALKGGKIGMLQYWGFNDSYIFKNLEKEKLEHLKSIDEVQIISRDEWDKLYEKRDKKINSENGNEVSKFQRAWFNIDRGTTDKSGKWMMDFCNEIGSVWGFVEMYDKSVSIINEIKLKKLRENPVFKRLAFKNLYMNPFSERAFEEDLSEEEIVKVVGQIKSLPKEWIKGVKFHTKEMEHYMKISPAIELNFKPMSEEEKSKILLAENTLEKNVKEETLKTIVNGHIPYGNAYWELSERIKRRNESKDNSELSDDIKIADRVIGIKIYKDGDGCYSCGAKLGFEVKDENTIEFFEWDYSETYKKIEKDRHKCELSDRKSKINSFDLTFPTGQVVIDNYFLDKDGEYLFNIPKEEEYSNKYTLQTLRGRFNLQNYIAETYNVGYAQMGNMSFDVFINKNKTKLIFGRKPNDWYDEDSKSAKKEEDDKFNEDFEKEYTKIGDVSCSVWRWECADKKVLIDAGHNGEGEVVAKLKPGTYTVTHYYGCVPTETNPKRYSIYSEITLKNEK